MMPQQWNKILIGNVRSNNIQLVNRSLFYGADINTFDRDGNTALAMATKRGFTDIMQLLLSQKADIFVSGPEGKPPLHWAIVRGHLEAVKLLLSAGASVNKIDDKGNVPLLYAAQEGRIEIANYLINKGADVNKMCSNGSTPMSEAIIAGNLQFVQLLASKGAYIDKTDPCGNSPIALATKCKHLNIVKFFIDIEANVCKFTHGKGKPPLSWAVLNKDIDMIDVLLDHGGQNSLKIASIEATKPEYEEILQHLTKNMAVIEDTMPSEAFFT